ncbi:MAG: dihydroorotate dehydrogenase electron transfer subunit [Oscillospiraceae bacterium]|jgi:dihydroorotate dehydrogenase electron transfer subunit|nr:dihydroorotate dehydrogenase electron transfer subunit [Oscillospiraceae bacterium]
MSNCVVTASRLIGKNIRSLSVRWAEKPPKPGQFVNIRADGAFLRRPISVCDYFDGTLTVVFEVRGEGTRALAQCVPGQLLDVLGPLGQGFQLPKSGDVLLVGGGAGSAPMLCAAKALSGRASVILGFRGAEHVVLDREIADAAREVYITTNDGSRGFKGFPTLLMPELLKKPYAAVFVCGPRPLMKAVAQIAKDFGIPCQVSLEERMACGVGACLVCVCKTRENGAETMRRICSDGPVFDAAEVIW